MPLIINPYALGPGPFSGLTYKGRGIMRDTTSLTANYGTVDDGSAPVAGDVVMWLVTFYSVPGPISPGAMTGWARQAADGGDPIQVVMVAAKVLDAGDISAPPSLGSITGAMVALWVAFSVTGLPPTIAASSIDGQWAGSPGTSARTADSSSLNPPAVAITWAAGGGEDSALSFSGITMDQTVSWNNYASNADILFGFKLDVGGASYSINKGDDGSSNSMFAGYVSAS